jgi:hypothetical protein
MSEEEDRFTEAAAALRARKKWNIEVPLFIASFLTINNLQKRYHFPTNSIKLRNQLIDKNI